MQRRLRSACRIGCALHAASAAPCLPASLCSRRVRTCFGSRTLYCPRIRTAPPFDMRPRNCDESDMSDGNEKKDNLLEQIADVHEQFIDVMNERLPEIGERELELYLGVLGKLVAKVEQR